MRIAQITPLTESVPPKNQHGLEYVVSYLTEELVRRGHEVTLFAPGGSKTSSRLISILKWPLGSAKQPLPRSDHFYRDFNIAACLSMGNEFDLIHSHDTTIIHHAGLINKPVLVTAHHPKRPPLLPSRSAQRKFRHVAKPSNCFFSFVSRSQSADHGDPQPSFVVPNGIPVATFPFNPRPKNYVAYLGWITEDKGADLAIMAAKKAGIPIQLAGRAVPEFFEKKIKPHLSKTVRYLGPLNFHQKIDLLKNAKALLMPIRWNEPFGLVMIEALACGTPVIGFRKAAVPEIVKHKTTGYIVSSVPEMAEAIRKVNAIHRQDCRNDAERRFSVTAMTDAYEAIYNSLI